MSDKPRAGLKTLNHRSDWQTARLKYLFKRESRPVLQTDEVVTAFRDGTVTLRKNRREDGFTFAEQEIGYQGIEPGDLVIHAMDGFAGAIGVSDSRGKGSPVLSVATPIAAVEPRFWGYYLRDLAVAGFIQSLAKGIRERSTDFRWKDASNLLVNFPDLDTQRQIADFLDRETARIDLLIEKKQRLVALLEEKFRSTITDALSRGLDRSAPLKSTGLDWLPEVPEHWTVQPLRTLIWYQEGPGILAVDFHDEGVPLLRIKGLGGRFATLNGCNYLDPEKVKARWKHFCVEVGDYLISASATTGGIATEVTAETAGAVPYTGIIRIKPRRRGYVREIIPMFLLSTLFEEQIDLLSAGSTIQHFGPSHLSRMKAPFPPKREQFEIAKRLSAAQARTKETSERVNASIDRLKEYRSALITAAVTGQIDVQTYGKSGTVDRKLDEIQEEMEA